MSTIVIFLDKQVMQVVKRTDSLKRISFLSHSLGGLFARYAVGVLYSPISLESGEPVDLAESIMTNSQTGCSSRQGTIAGLEPVNFITLATPHLGVRGRKQVCPGGYWLFYLLHCHIILSKTVVHYQCFRCSSCHCYA